MAEVRFEDVSKRFGTTIAVKNLNLSISDKEFLVLVGPSGCGKSTTLRLLSGLEEPDAGRIYIADRLVNNVAPKDRDIAMVFQSYALYPHMSVYDNMAFGLSLRKTPRAEIARRVKEAAHILGIDNLLRRKPGQLSGGQRQRVALGRAIVREAAAFLLDEPLSNLDAKLRVQTRAELSKLHQRLGTTFVYVTHDQVEAMTMATRIVVMNEGVLQQIGSPQELYERPGNIFVAGFIGSPTMNFFEVVVGSDGDRIYLDAGSFRLDVPSSKATLLKDYTEKRINFGIRPEHIHQKDFLPAGYKPTPAVSGDCLITEPVKVKVDVTELMGNELFLHLLCEDRPFMARVDSRTSAKPGEEIEIVFNMANMHAFDTQTGEALAQ